MVAAAVLVNFVRASRDGIRVVEIVGVSVGFL